MSRFWRILLAAALLSGLLFQMPFAQAATTDDLVAELKQQPGVISVREKPVAQPYRYFLITITQLIDHRNPAAGTFQQRLSLLHRGLDRPMILHTTGYGLYEPAFRSEPTQLVDGNQISVEQRFFEPSRPDPADWSKLDIWQAASDHHTIVTAFHKMYSQKWLSTGASKGGMASVYHRRFYPSDVDGTVVYVAPNNVNDNDDTAYDKFLASVGTDTACRKAVNTAQIELLRRRKDMLKLYTAYASNYLYSFTILGSADRAYESTVNSASWDFWQYFGKPYCSSVPSVKASNTALFSWLSQLSLLDTSTDQGIEPYIPYFYQAASQLGSPDLALTYLRKLQHYRGQDTTQSYLPPGLHPSFQPKIMADIDHWVREESTHMLFVYGSDDPWSAEPFRLGNKPKDNLWYIANGANHGADISALTTAQQTTAVAAVRYWAGLSGTVQTKPTFPSLDNHRLSILRSINP